MQVGSGGGEIGVGDGGVVREFVGERITELRGHESRIFCAEWDPTGEISPSSVPPVSMSPSECGLHHGMPADRRCKLCKSSCLQLSFSMLSLPLISTSIHISIFSKRLFLHVAAELERVHECFLEWAHAKPPPFRRPYPRDHIRRQHCPSLGRGRTQRAQNPPRAHRRSLRRFVVARRRVSAVCGLRRQHCSVGPARWGQEIGASPHHPQSTPPKHPSSSRLEFPDPISGGELRGWCHLVFPAFKPGPVHETASKWKKPHAQCLQAINIRPEGEQVLAPSFPAISPTLLIPQPRIRC
jgi:hypothetical protein